MGQGQGHCNIVAIKRAEETQWMYLNSYNFLWHKFRPPGACIAKYRICNFCVWFIYLLRIVGYYTSEFDWFYLNIHILSEIKGSENSDKDNSKLNG